jgi:hypothetical protein
MEICPMNLNEAIAALTEAKAHLGGDALFDADEPDRKPAIVPPEGVIPARGGSDVTDEVLVLRALDRRDPDGRGAVYRQLGDGLEMPRGLVDQVVCRLHARGIVELCSVVVTLGSGEQRSVLGIRRVPRDGRTIPSSETRSQPGTCRGRPRQRLRRTIPSRETRSQQPPPARAFVWDQAAAEGLLADLRATVERLKHDDFRGKPPPIFVTLAAGAIAIAEKHIANHEAEAARGWDVLDLLRGRKRVLLEIAARVQEMVAPTRGK